MKVLLAAFGIFLGWNLPASAQSFLVTMYNDGFSCPGNCDAHVVFHRAHNGTKAAFAPPILSRNAPQKCVRGSPCLICFANEDASCIEAFYRGNGPDRFRFDFTPAFFEQNCDKPSLPKPLENKCRRILAQANELLKTKTYCVEKPDHALCKDLMTKAVAAQMADKPFRDDCKALGQDAYNKKHKAEPGKQRDQDCEYTKQLLGGPNSNGERWQRLTPAACPTGSVVGRDGLDCCSKSHFVLGGLESECKIYLRPL
jgi:hypothetical protein